MEKLSVEELEKKIEELTSQQTELRNKFNETFLEGKAVPESLKKQLLRIEGDLYILRNHRASRVKLGDDEHQSIY